MNAELYTEELAAYQRRPTWELNNVRRALRIMPILNTPRETARLDAVNAILKQRKQKWRTLAT